MSIVKIDILNHADYGAAFREDYEVPGISRFYTAIESVRKNNPEHTLLLDAGDNFKSWLWHENVQEGIALLKTDVYEYGNHDFDWGQENIEVSTQRLLDLGVPIVCSNVVEKATGNLVKGAKPYVVFEKGGIKYGVLGLITEYTPYMVTYKYFLPYKVIDSVECARKYIPMMREEGAEVIIVLTHYPFYFTETDESGELIDILDQIIDLKPDCMIGGHIPGDYARVYKDVIVTKGGFGGVSLPHAILYFDTETRKVVGREGEVIDVKGGDFEKDPEVEKFVERVVGPKEYYFSEVIGEAVEDIPSRLDFESPMADLMADIIMDKYHTDFVYFNNTSLGRVLPKGELTRSSAMDITGFNDPLYQSKYTGQKIWDLFELVHDPDVFGNNGNISFAGFTVKMDHTKPKGSKVVYIREPNGKDIDLNKEYTVTSSEYMSSGGNGTRAVAQSVQWQETGDRMFDIISEYIIKYRQLRCPELGRYIFIGKPENDNSPW
ncbi:MAG: 5'-nucleotidase C-terminal domain-containing protein [Erysipelotrichaceae bacterium]|nr:5'-nucleotidase C-terminal domain-containing protein [Erysipelotrichaceae bacterium]